MQKYETRPPTYSIHKDKIKLDIRLKCKCKTIKILEVNIGSKISDISHSNIFADTSPKVREVKIKMNKWDHIKLKIFYTTTETTNKMKRELTVWVNISANDISD